MRLLIVVVWLAAWPSSAWATSVTSRERVTCSIAAALKFRLPPELVLAIAEMEGGKPGQWVRNKNGSHDVGPMQFNTKYLAHLQARYGITAADVAASGCYPYELAAWRLRRHVDRDRGDFWTRAANYHSRHARHNAKYRRKLVLKAARWSAWLARTGSAGIAAIGAQARAPAGDAAPGRSAHPTARAPSRRRRGDAHVDSSADFAELQLLAQLDAFEHPPARAVTLSARDVVKLSLRTRCER